MPAARFPVARRAARRRTAARRAAASALALSAVAALAGCGAGTASSPRAARGTAPPNRPAHAAGRPSGSPAPAFAPAIRAAMWDIGTAGSFPLAAPTVLPGPPSPRTPDLAAQVQLSSAGWLVRLWWTAFPVVLNRPVPESGGLADFLGSFAARSYGSAPDARAAAAADNPYWGSAPRTGGRPVALGDGVVARAGTGWVVWRQRGWTVGVFGGPVAAAAALRSTLAAARLPAAHGVLAEEVAGDGDHTAVSWAAGRVVYTVTDYQRARAALQMAASLAPFPGVAVDPAGPPLPVQIQDVESLDALNPWIRLARPTQGQPVAPGTTLVVSGTVTDPAFRGVPVGLTLLAGSVKPARAIADVRAVVAAGGTLSAAIPVPRRWPPIHGPALTLEIQPAVRGGVLTQVLLVPQLPATAAGG